MPTFETINRCAVCWSEKRLRERAKLWPTPLTWEWLFGDRCAAFSRAELVEFLALAVTFIKHERVSTLPMSARALWLARNAQTPVLLAALAALGVVFDLWEMGDRQVPDDEILEALLNYATGARSSIEENPVRIESASVGGTETTDLVERTDER